MWLYDYGKNPRPFVTPVFNQKINSLTKRPFTTVELNYLDGFDPLFFFLSTLLSENETLYVSCGSYLIDYSIREGLHPCLTSCQLTYFLFPSVHIGSLSLFLYFLPFPKTTVINIRSKTMNKPYVPFIGMDKIYELTVFFNIVIKSRGTLCLYYSHLI